MTDYPESYLGDGVYASCDGYHIWLDLRAQDPNVRIALEPPVFKRLLEYEKRLRKFAEEHSDAD